MCGSVFWLLCVDCTRFCSPSAGMSAPQAPSPSLHSASKTALCWELACPWGPVPQPHQASMSVLFSLNQVSVTVKGAQIEGVTPEAGSVWPDNRLRAVVPYFGLQLWAACTTGVYMHLIYWQSFCQVSWSIMLSHVMQKGLCDTCKLTYEIWCHDPRARIESTIRVPDFHKEFFLANAHDICTQLQANVRQATFCMHSRWARQQV